jgi:hypothetical protein
MTIKKQQFKSWRNRLGLSQVKAAVILVTSLSMIKKTDISLLLQPFNLQAQPHQPIDLG